MSADSERRRVWRSSPSTTPGWHERVVVMDGTRVTRTMRFPGQPDRPDQVEVYDAPTEQRAVVMFGIWSSVTIKYGWRLVASTEVEDIVEDMVEADEEAAR